MIEIKDEKLCCGCAACAAVCPKKCIKMTEGTLGAVFPEVNKDLCVSCGLCESVCPMLGTLKNENEKTEVFAAYAKDGETRFKGSSGGMFGTFANELLPQGFMVYGAAFDEDLKLKCRSASSKEELQPLFKSKYLQSDLSGKYAEIEQNLKNGKKILFVSTPCQVAALRLFLKKDYENLITVDFLCHGVPSQQFFDRCREYEENKKGIKFEAFEFRSKKKNGSTPHYYTLSYNKNGKAKKETGYYFDSPFYAAFQRYINLRESCYDCRFAGAKRNSDITISDFHEIERYIKGINRFDGVSTVFVHTKKGKWLWENCKDKTVNFSLELGRLIGDGVCFQGGTNRPAERDEFAKMYEEDFKKLADKFLNPKLYKKQRFYYSLPLAARKILKKLKGI